MDGGALRCDSQVVPCTRREAYFVEPNRTGRSVHHIMYSCVFLLFIIEKGDRQKKQQ